MKKIHLVILLSFLSVTQIFAQCPSSVNFTVSQNGCSYVFTDVSTYPVGFNSHRYWFINGYPTCCLPYSDSAVLSGTFTNGEQILLTYYDNTYSDWCVNGEWYTVGCGAGCPGITQNFSVASRGYGEYAFIDSSVGQDSSARYGWSVNGFSQNAYGRNDSTRDFFISTQTIRVCDTIIEPNCATTYVLCKNVSVYGCPYITQQWNFTDSPGHRAYFSDYSTGADTSAVYSWTFGDSTTADTGRNAFHIFPDTGLYYICETIAEPTCAPYTSCKLAYIYYQLPCSADISAWSYTILSGDTVAFVDQTPGADSTYTYYEWFFGDGTVDTTSHPVHVFSDTAAAYLVCERAVYSYCTYAQPNSVCDTIRVGTCPTVSQHYTYSYDSTSKSYTFTDSSTGQGNTASYAWIFGDGGTSAGSTVTYAYSNPGVYKVYEIVTPQFCSPDTFYRYITYNPCTYNNVHMNFTVAYLGSGYYEFTDVSSGISIQPYYVWTIDSNYAGSGYTNFIDHTFTTYGQHIVCDYLNNPGCITDTLCKTIDYAYCPTITQNVNYSIDNAEGSLYTFTDASTGQDGNATYSWNFGDGYTGTGTPVNHTYTASGTYTITETITEPGCTPVTETGSITVTVCPVITPDFTYTAGQDGSYTFSSTATGQNSQATWQWDFGDQTSGSGSTTSHTYTSSGIYTVMMTITEPGCTGYTYSETVNVIICPAISQSFDSWNHGAGSYTFTDASVGPDGSAGYSWSFGDGGTGTGTPDNHTYAASGTYTICETITEPNCNAYPPHCEQVTVDVLSSGVSNISASAINIHPNPASTALTVDMGATDLSDGGMISIINQLGQESGRQPVTAQVSSLDVSSLPDGIYIISIKVGSAEYHYTVAVLH